MSKKAERPGGISGESNNILYVEGLSKVTQTVVLNDIFRPYSGFKEVRHFPEK